MNIPRIFKKEETFISRTSTDNYDTYKYIIWKNSMYNHTVKSRQLDEVGYQVKMHPII